jgi:C4-dicarboxylate-binding protein DctP
MTRCTVFAIFLFAITRVLLNQAIAEPMQLRATLQLPVSNHLGRNLTLFKDEIYAQSQGDLRLEIYDNSQRYNDNEVIPAVAAGKIEMGVVLLSQFAEQIPAVDIYQQPFLFNKEALVRAATSPDRDMRKLVDKAILQTSGVRVLWWQTYGSTVFFSNKRDKADPSELADTKVRVFGQTMADFTQHCGGKPMTITASKQHDAIKDGTVDMAMTGITGVDGRQLWKVTDTIMKTEHAAIEFVVIINEVVWQSLNETRRHVIGAAARKAESDLRDRFVSIEADAYKFAAGKGMKVLEPSPDQIVQWRACSAPVLENFMANSGDLGRQLLSAYGRLRSDPCCNAPAPGEFTNR